jgi:hypothetical protein
MGMMDGRDQGTEASREREKATGNRRQATGDKQRAIGNDNNQGNDNDEDYGDDNRLAATLDVETGQEVRRGDAGRKAEYISLEWDGRRWTGNWAGLTWIISDQSRQLRVARPEQPLDTSARLLALAGDARLGASLYGLHFGDGTLVLATFEGYIFCIDLGAVQQALGSADSQP